MSVFLKEKNEFFLKEKIGFFFKEKKREKKKKTDFFQHINLCFFSSYRKANLFQYFIRHDLSYFYIRILTKSSHSFNHARREVFSDFLKEKHKKKTWKKTRKKKHEKNMKKITKKNMKKNVKKNVKKTWKKHEKNYDKK